jgi:hypothetical protein
MAILEKVPWAAEKDVFCAGILCRLSVLLDLSCHLVLEFLCWFFCQDDLSIGDKGVLKFPLPLCLGLSVI